MMPRFLVILFAFCAQNMPVLPGIYHIYAGLVFNFRNRWAHM
jgi:hypothetical protein